MDAASEFFPLGIAVGPAHCDGRYPTDSDPDGRGTPWNARI